MRGPESAGWNQITLDRGDSAAATNTHGTLDFTVKNGYWRALANGEWQVILDVAMENLTSQDRQIGSWFFTLVVSERE